MLRWGQGDINLPRDFKSYRAATVTRTAVQQQYNSTSASKSGLSGSHGTFVFI